MLVKDHMRTPVISISCEAHLDRALSIMRSQRIRHIPVVDDAYDLVGLISDRDLRMAMQEQENGPTGAKGFYLPALTKISSVMITQVLTATPEMPMANAVNIMSERKIGTLPVLQAGTRKVVGIITETDMLRLLGKLLKQKG